MGFVNISDVAHEPLYKPYHYQLFGGEICAKTILCMPIHGKGEVQGLAVLINKRNGDVFSTKDEDILSAICSHIFVSMSDTTQTFDEILDTCQRSVKRQGSPEWNISARQRKMELYEPVL